jgi:S-adenosylmethionine hydrolase
VTVPLGRQFADVGRGEPLAYIGSSGLLEIGVNHGSAREQLNLTEGQPVRLENRG